MKSEDVSQLEHQYKERFGKFPEMFRRMPMSEFAERIQKALDSGEPIVDPTPPGILT